MEKPRQVAQAIADRIAESDDDLDEAFTERNNMRASPIASETQRDDDQDDSEEDVFDYTKSPEYKALAIEINNNLMRAIKVQLRNTSALVRRAVILVLEFIASTNLNMDELLLSNVS